MARVKRKPVRDHQPVVVKRDDDGVFIVSVPMLRGCRNGHSLKEAMENLTKAAALCMEDERPESFPTLIGLRDLELVANEYR